MSRTRLPIVPHLTPDQIYHRYRACRTGVEKTHWHLIWLLTRPERPLAPAQAAAEVGLTPVWARAILKRWNAAGPDGLADRRVGACGGRSKLTTDQQIDLWAALQQPPPRSLDRRPAPPQAGHIVADVRQGGSGAGRLPVGRGRTRQVDADGPRV